MLTKVPSVVKKLFPKRIWNLSAEGKNLYLSFDDGPIPSVTPWVLSVLREYKAKATFFCIGENVQKHPQIFQQIKKEGHTVGNHTFHHLNGWKTSTEDYILNAKKATLVIESEYFRPPYGKLKPAQASQLQRHFKIVMWDVLSEDYNTKLSAEKCLKNVLKNAGSGSIIVFHDSLKAEKNLKYVLPKVLQHYKEKGFTFKALYTD